MLVGGYHVRPQLPVTALRGDAAGFVLGPRCQIWLGNWIEV